MADLNMLFVLELICSNNDHLHIVPCLIVCENEL